MVTKEEIQAARRIQKDFPFFAETCLMIKTKEDGIVPFRLNKAQRFLWSKIKEREDAGEPVRIIILKARQLGMSTFVQGYLMWKAVTQPATNGLVVSHMKDHASRLFEKIELMYDRLPKPLYDEMQSVRNSKKTGLKLSWGGTQQTSIHVETAGNKNLGRGDTINFCHLSEMAFYDDAEDIVFGLNASIPKGAKSAVIIESTANGMGNYFARQWKRAKESKSNYIPIFLPWFWDEKNQIEWKPGTPPLSAEERDIKNKFGLTKAQMLWRRTSIEDDCDGDVEKFKQENPADEQEGFLISGRPVFHKPSVEQMLREAHKYEYREGILEHDGVKPEFVEYEGGEWRVYESPEKHGTYVIGADVAAGTSRDYSAAHILEVRTNRIVATFRGKLDEDQFALQLKWMGLAYNTALIAVERNNSGRACLLALQRMNYNKMFYHQHEDEWSGGVRQQWGWTTNQITRPVMIAQLASQIRDMSIHIPDRRTLEELASFVHRGKKPQAAKGSWDDMVMSLCITASDEVRGQGYMHSAEYHAVESQPTVSDITGY